MGARHGGAVATIPWDGTHKCDLCGRRWRTVASGDVLGGLVRQEATFEACPSCGRRTWVLWRGYRDGSVGTEAECLT